MHAHRKDTSDPRILGRRPDFLTEPPSQADHPSRSGTSSESPAPTMDGRARRCTTVLSNRLPVRNVACVLSIVRADGVLLDVRSTGIRGFDSQGLDDNAKSE